MTERPDPTKIIETGLAFMPSKTLLSAVELELFTALADHPMTAAQVGERFSLHPRALRDFLDALTSMSFLEREGSGVDAVYSNSAAAGAFLNKNERSYIGGMFEMLNNRLYPFWGSLTEGLRSGKPQNEIARGGEDFFAELYADEQRLEEFLHAMAGFQMGNFIALAEGFEFSDFGSVCDVGGALGALSVQVASRHADTACFTFDLPPVKPFAQRYIEAAGMKGRVEVMVGDFFDGPLPSADVITMGNILHDWDEETKLTLIRKAYEALPSGGALIAIENIIDDERRENTMGLLMSLNMLIETPGGFDYTMAQFDGWARLAGFERTEIRPLTGPTSAAIAWKA